MEIYQQQIDNVQSLQELNDLRVKLLGRNGIITNELKLLSALPIEERKNAGQKLNKQKIAIEEYINNKEKTLQDAKRSINEIDYTIEIKSNIGMRHLLSKAIEKLDSIFANSGFANKIGPDIEDIFYNFEALNIDAAHPARDNHDTFYMQNSENMLLRTHVTCVQIRLLEEMQKNKQKETRTYSIGRVYRNDTHDATHACSFQQIEGIIIEDGVTMEHLKGFLEHIYSEFFEQKVKLYFRPSHFPFTEPSCEVDVFTKNVDGKLIICDEGKPLELGGCGIIHPSILERFDLHNKQAFAFGMGLERLVMIKYGITNLHDLYNNHIPTLKHISQC